MIARLTGALGCLLIVAVLGGALFAVAGMELFLERQEVVPADAVRHYLDDVDAGEMSAAHERLCRELKERHTPRSLARTMERLLDDVGGRLGSWNVDDVPYPRGEGRFGVYFDARGVRMTPRRYQVIVIREDDAWRLCGFSR